MRPPTCTKCGRGASGLHTSAEGAELCLICLDQLEDEQVHAGLRCEWCGQLNDYCNCAFYGDL